MNRNRLLAALATVCLGVAVYVGLPTAAASAGPAPATPFARSGGAELPQGPTTWVPFSAEKVKSTPGGTSRDRFYRYHDGSTRTEAFGPAGLSIVTIQNFPMKMLFLRTPEGSWGVAAVEAKRLVPSPRPRLLASSRVLATPEAMSGVTVYRIQEKNNVWRWVAPELNFLEVRREDGHGVTEYRNIVVGGQPAELFRPPSGASLRPARSIKDLFSILTPPPR